MKSVLTFAAVVLGSVSCLSLFALQASSTRPVESAPRSAQDNSAKIASSPYTPHKKNTLTFSKDVAPIMLTHCATCHRPGEVAPFSLLNYADVKKRARQIAMVTASRQMPPWKADSHGEFEDENRLTTAQIGLIQQWSEEGMKEGRTADMPAPPTFTSGWKLGKPDAELEPVNSYTLGPEGRDEFHTFLLPTNFSEDRFLTAVEVRPGNRAVVHHTIVSVDTSGKKRKLAAAHGGSDFAETNGSGVPEDVLDIWTPGKLSERLPDGVGMRLPKGADVVLEIHYHRSGKPEQDKTKIGLYFCKGPVNQRLHVFGLPVSHLAIPPGEAHYQTDALLPVPADTTLHTIFPHMHLIGKSMSVMLTLPDGSLKTLVDVPDWDFNWQNTYRYKEPVKIPKGSKIKMVATYDNSTANPRNPNTPPKAMGWGEQTTNEMGLVFFGFTVDGETLASAKK